MAKWYYQAMGRTFGPISYETLVRELASGNLNEAILLSESKNGPWLLPEQLEGLLEEAVELRLSSSAEPNTSAQQPALTLDPEGQCVDVTCPHCNKIIRCDAFRFVYEITCKHCAGKVLVPLKQRQAVMRQWWAKEQERQYRPPFRERLFWFLQRLRWFVGDILWLPLDYPRLSLSIGIPLLIALAILIISSVDFSSPSTPSTTYNPPRTERGLPFGEFAANERIKERIRRDLRSPSTASFPFFLEYYASQSNSNLYMAKGYVDAQNGFGAPVRTHFRVTLNSSGNITGIEYAE